MIHVPMCEPMKQTETIAENGSFITFFFEENKYQFN